MRRTYAMILGLGLILAASRCSSSDSEPGGSATGGASGSATGGSSTGGSFTGGSSNGGSSTGGNSSGGTNQGGSGGSTGGGAGTSGSAGQSQGGGAGEAGASGAGGQSPGAHFVLNEIYPAGDPTDTANPTDWIEIKNTGDASGSLDGYAVAQKYDGTTFPPADDIILLSGTVPAGGYIVITTSSDADAGAQGTFGIGVKKAERITLFDPSQTMVDDTTTDGTSDSPFLVGTTWARLPDGTGAWGRHAVTRGTTNAP